VQLLRCLSQILQATSTFPQALLESGRSDDTIKMLVQLLECAVLEQASEAVVPLIAPCCFFSEFCFLRSVFLTHLTSTFSFFAVLSKLERLQKR
jgi:hypothetical protein